jgi:hypothetical protein
VVVSGSRSGLVGAMAAVAFVLARARMGGRAKLAVAAGVAAVLAVGLGVSPVFQDRVERLWRMGASEANVSGRVHAQALAVRASLEYPLGVGYRSIGWATRSGDTYYAFATTDSAYLDTLLGAGVPGLAALLLLLRAAWRSVARQRRSREALTILKAGLAAFALFGAATVVPISIFLAPLFFAIASGGSYVRADDGA